MQIPVGHETFASTTQRTEFHCKRCGHRATADVVGIGQGMQSFLNASGTAQRRARTDATKDIARTIRTARCPSCKRRNPGALLAFWQPFLIVFAIAAVAGVVCGYLPTWADMNMAEHDRAICRWVLPLIFVGTAALVVPIQALVRWANLDARVRWVDDDAGKP